MPSQLSLRDWMTDAGVGKWFQELEAADAPLPHENVKTALRFFDQHMARLPPAMALNFLLAIDLSRPVRVVPLTSADHVIAFRTGHESPFKLFYTRAGASVHNSGVNPHGRTAVRFSVRSPCLALESHTTGAIDTWSIPAEYQRLTVAPRAGSFGHMAHGGGIQLIIPDSFRYLAVETR